MRNSSLLKFFLGDPLGEAFKNIFMIVIAAILTITCPKTLTMFEGVAVLCVVLLLNKAL